MSAGGMQLHPASHGPSTSYQRTPLAHRIHSSLHGKVPPSHGQTRQQVQCKFRKDESQDGVGTVFPQAQVLTKTALRKYPKAKLEEELRKRDLDTLGTKPELVERLHAALTVFLVEEQTTTEASASVQKRDDRTVPHLLGSEPATFEEITDTMTISLETDNSLATLMDLTKRDLQQALAERGLAKTGNKTDLAQRLFAALQDERSVLLAEQMEASAELQRQYEEAAATSGFRRPGLMESSSGDDEDEEFSRWAAQAEGEQGSYGLTEDTEEDPRVRTRASAEMEYQDWRMRESRPSEILEMFEHQGTAAAELASEDYAHHQRAERTHLVAAEEGPEEEVTVEDSQDIDDDMNPSVTGSRVGRQQQVSPFEEDNNRFDTENELEDGFSFVTDEADGFDSDAEEQLAQLDSSRAQALGRQPESAQTAADEFSPRHRNYQNLSARSPDDFEDELDEDADRDADGGEEGQQEVVDSLAGEAVPPSKEEQTEEGTLAGTGRRAAAVSGAAADGEAAFLGRASPLNPLPPSAGSKISIPDSGKGKGVGQRHGKTALTHAAAADAASAVVASQGVSSLDNTTALEWMRTRLPEAALLASALSPAMPTTDRDAKESLSAPEEENLAAESREGKEAEAPQALQAADAVEAPQTEMGAEKEAETLQTVQAAGAVEVSTTEPEQSAEDLALLETEAPVQLVGFEVATEEPHTAPAEQPMSEALKNIQALPPDAEERAAESDCVADILADAPAVEGVVEGTAEAETEELAAEMEEIERSSAMAEDAGAPTEEAAATAEEAAVLLQGAAEAVLETDVGAETPLSAAEEDTQESGVEILAADSVPAMPIAPVGDVMKSREEPSDGAQLPQQVEVAALQVEMKQKHEAIAALQSKMEAASNVGDDNAARIASLQAALVELQSQQLAWQRDNLSERLAALLDATSQASLNTTAKDELKAQLEAMRGELTQLEADLSSRDTEAAKLSRALAEARAKLSDPDIAPAGAGSRIPGSIQVKLDMDLEQLAGSGPEVHAQSSKKPGLPFPSVQPAASRSAAATGSSKAASADARKPSFDAGSALTAGLVGAVKLVSNLFGLGGKPDKSSRIQSKGSEINQEALGKEDGKDI